MSRLWQYASVLDDAVETLKVPFLLRHRASQRGTEQVKEELRRATELLVSSSSSDPDAIAPKPVAMQLGFLGSLGSIHMAVNLAAPEDFASHRAFLYEGVLTSAVAAFEAHLGELASAFYRVVPEKLDSAPEKGLPFSVTELLQLGSIENCIQALADRRSDQLMRGTLEKEWTAFFEGVGVSMPTVCHEWEWVREVVKRRHALVHTRSKVNQDYRRTVNNGVLKELFGGVPEVGVDLAPDSDYMMASLSRLENAGLVLGHALWLKARPKDVHHVWTSVLNIIDGAASVGHWPAVEGLSKWAKNRTEFEAPPFDQEDRFVFRLDEWTAQQASGRLSSETLQKIRDMNTGSWTVRFRLSRLAILGEWDQFRALLEQEATILSEVSFGPVLCLAGTRSNVQSWGFVGGHYMKVHSISPGTPTRQAPDQPPVS